MKGLVYWTGVWYIVGSRQAATRVRTGLHSFSSLVFGMHSGTVRDTTGLYGSVVS